MYKIVIHFANISVHKIILTKTDRLIIFIIIHIFSTTSTNEYQ